MHSIDRLNLDLCLEAERHKLCDFAEDGEDTLWNNGKRYMWNGPTDREHLANVLCFYRVVKKIKPLVSKCVCELLYACGW